MISRQTWERGLAKSLGSFDGIQCNQSSLTRTRNESRLQTERQQCSAHVAQVRAPGMNWLPQTVRNVICIHFDSLLENSRQALYHTVPSGLELMLRPHHGFFSAFLLEASGDTQYCVVE